MIKRFTHRLNELHKKNNKHNLKIHPLIRFISRKKLNQRKIVDSEKFFEQPQVESEM